MNMVKTYRMNRVVVFVVAGIYMLTWVVAFASGPKAFTIDSIFVLAGAIGILLFFDLAYGTRLTLEDGVLSRTDYFFAKKSIAVEKISSINYQPTFILGKTNRSLYFFQEDRERPRIEMSNTWFTKDTLKQIVRDLRAENPAIRLDQETEELVK